MTTEEEVKTWWQIFKDYLPELAGAVLAVVAAIVIGRYVRRLVRNAVSRITSQQSISSLAGTLSYVIIVIIGALISLRILNLDGVVTSVLAGAGIVGLALGFAFQDIASNFIAGVAIAVQKQINVGDLVEVQDIFGIVKEVHLRNTTIQTLEGQTVYVPNKDIFTNVVTDYTHLGKRRIDLKGGVSYGDDLEKVKHVVLEAISSVENLAEGKVTDFYFEEFGDSSINFVVRYWVDFKKQPDFLEAQHQGIVAIKKAFDTNGITIPFPIRTLDFGIKGGKPLATQIKQ